MRIDYMRDLVAIREQGNISKAAKSRFISQPALSRHIADMEEALGVKLVDRDKHKAAFTEAGERAYQTFKRMIADYDALRDDLAAIKKGLTGTLRLGMLYYTVRQDLGNVLAKFPEEYPNVELKCISCQPQNVYEGLISDQLDVGILARIEYPEGEAFCFQDIASSPLSVWLPADHPLRSKRTITLRDIADETFIFLRDDPYTSRAIKEALGRCGFHPKKTINVDNIDTAPLAIVGQHAIHVDGSGFEIPGYEDVVFARPIDEPGLFMTKAFAYKKGNPNPIIPLFLNMASERD